MHDRDHVDLIIQDWARERSDLTARGLGIVSRISLLAKYFDRRDKTVLSELGLQPWAYEVLVALRRQGPPFQLSPTELRRLELLSSGGMTARLDRLEKRGLVQRSLSPADRRSFVITLTAEGRKLADRAITARLKEIERLLGSLDPTERESLADLLRKLLAVFTHEVVT